MEEKAKIENISSFFGAKLKKEIVKRRAFISKHSHLLYDYLMLSAFCMRTKENRNTWEFRQQISIEIVRAKSACALCS